MEFLGFKVEVSTEFECPKCFSSSWGTYGVLGSCSDCPFKWPRSEDYKVMHLRLEPVDRSDQQALWDAAHAEEE